MATQSTAAAVPTISPSSPSKSTQGHSRSSQSQNADPTLATQMMVGAIPTICTSSSYSWETKVSVPTGIVRFESRDWGRAGSIVNIIIGGGAKLTKMKAACQGSACTKIIGEENEEKDGEVKQRTDGSWFMKVTEGMQASLMITGEIVGTSKRKYPLSVSATPPCGLPVAKNCTSDDFTIDKDQWDAYSMADDIKEWVDETGVRNIDDFGKLAMREYLPTLDADRQECNITQELSCSTPSSDQCRDKSDVKGMKQMMRVQAYTTLVLFMHTTYTAVDDVMGLIGADIDSIVTKIWAPSAKQTFSTTAAIASSAIGFGTMAAVVIAEMLSFGIGAFLVAGFIAAASAVGLAGNLANGKEKDPSSPDAQTKKGAEFSLDAHDRLDAAKDALVSTMASNETGADGINEMFKRGAWVSQEVRDVIKNGLRPKVSGWYRREMTADYVARALAGYILFIKYTDNAPYIGRDWKITQKVCEERYQGNPKWKYAVDCEATYQPGGPLGMAVLTRPKDQGMDTVSLFDDPVVVDGHNVTAKAVMASAMHGQYKHGFNYSILNGDDWAGKVSKGGVASLQEAFRSKEPDFPGRYTIPVCEIEEIGYLPNVEQVANDWYSSQSKPWKKGPEAWPGAPGPCSCSGYWFQPGGGGKSKGYFKDFVSDAVVDTITDCKPDKWSKITRENGLPH